MRHSWVMVPHSGGSVPLRRFWLALLQVKRAPGTSEHTTGQEFPASMRMCLFTSKIRKGRCDLYP
jgi:hypothetical protein